MKEKILTLISFVVALPVVLLMIIVGGFIAVLTAFIQSMNQHKRLFLAFMWLMIIVAIVVNLIAFWAFS